MARRLGKPRPAAPRGAVLLRLAAPGAVLLALALVFTIATATRPGAAQGAAPGSQSAAVTSITRTCPPAAPGSAAPQVAMIALPSALLAAVPAGTATVSGILASGSSGAGQRAATAKPSPAATKTATKAATGAKPVTVTASGTVTTVAEPGGAGVAVAASGQMAEGFEAEQADPSGTGLVNCTHPGADMWFVGTGTSAGASQVWLYLMNPGNQAANVDVDIVTDTGVQNGLSNTTITVAPNQFVPENITSYVRGSQAIALHIQASTGQVAASAWEGGTGGGTWLPQANSPAKSLVIPGLTVARSSARLFVVVPGQTDAQLKVMAYTPAGAANQFPGAPVDATADAATPVALNSLGASAAGLKLTSNVPVVAGVLVPGSGIGAFTTAVPPLSEEGVIAGNPTTRGVTVGLLLTAPSVAARASISVISPDGTVTTPAGDQSVAVAAGHTLALSVPRPAQSGKQPFAIVVTPRPGSGPLYAARVVTTGAGGLSAPLSALLPVTSALTSIQLPPTRNSYTAVLP